MKDEKRMGRPTEIKDKTSPRTLSLDDATIDKARRIGGGNVSAGVREAVRRARIGKEVK